MPPLFITISTSSLENNSWHLLRHSSGLSRSSWKVCTKLGLLHSLLTRSSSAYLRAAMITFLAPSSSIRLASASPIPLEPPEMKTVLPVKSGLQVAQRYYWYKNQRKARQTDPQPNLLSIFNKNIFSIIFFL